MTEHLPSHSNAVTHQQQPTTTALIPAHVKAKGKSDDNINSSEAIRLFKPHLLNVQQQVSTIPSCHIPRLPMITHVLWQMWRLRNNSVFRGLLPDPNLAVIDASAQHRLVTLSAQTASQGVGLRTYAPLASKDYWWRSPEPGFIKCNIDGSFSPHQSFSNRTVCNWLKSFTTDGRHHGRIARSSTKSSQSCPFS